MKLSQCLKDVRIETLFASCVSAGSDFSVGGRQSCLCCASSHPASSASDMRPLTFTYQFQPLIFFESESARL